VRWTLVVIVVAFILAIPPWKSLATWVGAAIVIALYVVGELVFRRRERRT
jgi:hypothetical protein